MASWNGSRIFKISMNLVDYYRTCSNFLIWIHIVDFRHICHNIDENMIIRFFGASQRRFLHAMVYSYHNYGQYRMSTTRKIKTIAMGRGLWIHKWIKIRMSRKNRFVEFKCLLVLLYQVIKLFTHICPNFFLLQVAFWIIHHRFNCTHIFFESKW